MFKKVKRNFKATIAMIKSVNKTLKVSKEEMFNIIASDMGLTEYINKLTIDFFPPFEVMGLSNDIFGLTYKKDLNDSKFNIFIRDSISLVRDFNFLFLALHELRHVEQFVTNKHKLKEGLNYNDDNYSELDEEIDANNYAMDNISFYINEYMI